MKTKARSIILYSLQIGFMVFWLYVALDKMWSLSSFHTALLRQPFANWWADILYWALPLVELGIALLFVLQQQQKKYVIPMRNEETSNKSRKARSVFFTWHPRLPFSLSALLLLIFTIYIALGVAGLYSKRPCGCASVFNNLSWEWHLLVNILLFGLSTLGWYLSVTTYPFDKDASYRKPTKLFCAFLLLLWVPVYHIVLVVHKRFPRKFALFPGRPVSV